MLSDYWQAHPPQKQHEDDMEKLLHVLRVTGSMLAPDIQEDTSVAHHGRMRFIYGDTLLDYVASVSGGRDNY